eukprot:GDKH01020399.1.p2 GENE.GDKH01020399.1~~GDKH01020399.1.p2  ORF type:complete len:126 (+),score=42.13 GDKH01020399.1:123-500(+)
MASLNDVRRQKLAEMQGGKQEDAERAAAQEQQRQEMEERRHTILRAITDSEASERLNRISMVKPEKARRVEDMIIQMAQSGGLQGKLDDSTLVRLLERMDRGNGESNGPRVTIQRRRDPFDSDDD